MPVTSFCGCHPDKLAILHRSAISVDQPLFAFCRTIAALDRRSREDGRRSRAVCLPDHGAECSGRAIHPKAMPILITTAEIPCCGSSRKKGIRRSFECFLGADHGVGIDQQLASDGDQDDLGWFAGSGHARDEGGERLVRPFGAEGAHVERAAQALGSDAADLPWPAHGGAGAMLARRQADEGRECFGREIGDVGEFG